jgi:hypothetical protein
MPGGRSATSQRLSAAVYSLRGNRTEGKLDRHTRCCSGMMARRYRGRLVELTAGHGVEGDQIAWLYRQNRLQLRGVEAPMDILRLRPDFVMSRH